MVLSVEAQLLVKALLFLMFVGLSYICHRLADTEDATGQYTLGRARRRAAFIFLCCAALVLGGCGFDLVRIYAGK